MDKVLPCPFCGEQPKASNSYKQAFACQTTGCAMGGQSIHINMWNRRSPQPSAPVQAVAYENALRWCYDRLEGAPEYTLTPREQGNTYKEIGNVLRGIESAAGSYEAGEFDASAKIPRHIASPASASPSAPREPTEAEREALWAALRASSEIVHPGRLAPSAQPQPEEAANKQEKGQ